MLFFTFHKLHRSYAAAANVAKVLTFATNRRRLVLHALCLPGRPLYTIHKNKMREKKQQPSLLPRCTCWFVVCVCVVEPNEVCRGCARARFSVMSSALLYALTLYGWWECWRVYKMCAHRLASVLCPSRTNGSELRLFEIVQGSRTDNSFEETLLSVSYGRATCDQRARLKRNGGFGVGVACAAATAALAVLVEIHLHVARVFVRQTFGRTARHDVARPA